MLTLQGTILTPGEAEGPVLHLDEPLSFWGAFDPRSGEIIDQHHPQRGKRLAGKILVLPSSRGSGGTPGGIAEAIRRGTGPLGIILGRADINLAIGSFVAGELYDTCCPVITVDETDYSQLKAETHLLIHADGRITSAT